MKTCETKRQCLIAVISTAAILCGASAQAVQGFINVTDFVAADGKADVSDAIQRLIEANPNRTLWFADGTCLLSKPICTPAAPRLSVDIQLSNHEIYTSVVCWIAPQARESHQLSEV